MTMTITITETKWYFISSERNLDPFVEATSLEEAKDMWGDKHGDHDIVGELCREVSIEEVFECGWDELLAYDPDSYTAFSTGRVKNVNGEWVETMWMCEVDLHAPVEDRNTPRFWGKTLHFGYNGSRYLPECIEQDYCSYTELPNSMAESYIQKWVKARGDVLHNVVRW